MALKRVFSSRAAATMPKRVSESFRSHEIEEKVNAGIEDAGGDAPRPSAPLPRMKRDYAVDETEHMRGGENQRYEHHQLLKIALDVAGLAAVASQIIVGPVAALKLDDDEAGESEHNRGPNYARGNFERHVRVRQTDAETSEGLGRQPGDHQAHDRAKRGVATQFSPHATRGLVTVPLIIEGVFDRSRPQPRDVKGERSIGKGS